jgi:DNA-directed RNA polymerase subunit RPC12/RpoP
MIVKCPHCSSEILIEEKDINCGIFVHAVMKKSGKQVNPHSSQTLLNKLIKNKSIYGCGKVFNINK